METTVVTPVPLALVTAPLVRQIVASSSGAFEGIRDERDATARNEMQALNGKQIADVDLLA
jgi:hypothetical protein